MTANAASQNQPEMKTAARVMSKSSTESIMMKMICIGGNKAKGSFLIGRDGEAYIYMQVFSIYLGVLQGTFNHVYFGKINDAEAIRRVMCFEGSKIGNLGQQF